MKYYKTDTGEVYAYEDDGSQDHLIGDKVAITEDDMQTLTAPAPPTPEELEEREYQEFKAAAIETEMRAKFAASRS